MEITITNIRSFDPSKGRGLYIGRSTSQYWRTLLPKGDQYDLKVGNPFSIGKDGDRDEVIAQYKSFLNARYTNDGYEHRKILDYLAIAIIIADHYGAIGIAHDEEFPKPDLIHDHAIQLVCWCSPEPCHGQVIKDFIDHSIGEIYENIAQMEEGRIQREFMELRLEPKQKR